jgi:ubiquitin carboxyl-terminal hydrolase 4/11/15
MSEQEGRSQEDAAADTWNKHLHRNESIVTDLFHGQYKSTVCCTICDRVSITFDPMMALLLPIPAGKVTLKAFYIAHDLENGSGNKIVEVEMRGSESMSDLRKLIEQRYSANPASFIVTKVCENEFTRVFNAKEPIEELERGKGMTLIYEIDPALHE